MNTTSTLPFDEARDLKLELLLDADRALVWRCYTEPELLKQWFCPVPWKVTRAELDVRPGGKNLTVMCSPEGEEHPNPGVYLEVVPERRLVFTDAFTPGWVIAEKPFMVAIVSFDDAPGQKTKYVAIARHFSEEGKAQHEAMGFHEGWTKAAKQLEALARSLKKGAAS